VTLVNARSVLTQQCFALRQASLYPRRQATVYH